MPEERLQKALARAGLGSRRACEELITAGRVTVGGTVVTELGTRVDPTSDDIRVDGKPLSLERLRYIVLHKPSGYLSNPDPRAGYPSWVELVHVPERLFAVGRLDHDSEGLLLLTNDGELAQHLIHPRYEHAKTYLVQVAGIPNPRKIRRLQHGVMLDDGPTAPASVTLLRRWPEGVEGREMPQRSGGSRGPRTSWLKVTIREGRKRQLRRMFGLLGHPVLRVIRIELGPLALASLPAGKWRDLKPEEVQALREAASSGVTAAAAEQRARTEARQPGRQAVRKPSSSVPQIITIDGPSASGKSTVGRLLAQELGYLYFDTGVMYRAITAVALSRGLPVEKEPAITALADKIRLDVLPPTVADGRDVTVLADGVDITRDLRRPQVERAVSLVSAYPGVRGAMTAQQRRIGQGGRVVMVGRDIGTVVLPAADLKIYLDASLAERAQRRYLEQRARGGNLSPEQVLADMKRRDSIDSGREHSPLAIAADAILVDTTGLTVDQVMGRVRSLVNRQARQGPER
jgi:cytidylate kinase